MAKVTLNKSTKIKGLGLVLAGVETTVTAEQAKDLKSKGFLGEIKKSNTPANDKEIQALVKKVADLESGSNEEMESLKAELTAKDEEIESLKTELAEALKGGDDLLGENKDTKKK